MKNYIGTLDYIWAQGFNVDNVIPIPQNTGPVPNEHNPSDHFPIIADLGF